MFVPYLTNAQSTLSGKITTLSGEGIPAARIVIHNTFQGVVAAPDGSYTLSGIKPGTWVVEISALGYVTEKDTLQISTGNLTRNYMLEELSYLSEEIVVSALRAGDKTPATYTNLSLPEIEKLNYGQDLPYLFNLTPSTVVTSDAGAGVGYTGIRIRGVDPTRTNVTINGIPVNDSESHGTYWVDMPDFASSVENIQIQRGVGTSSNGAAAFGASINIKTNEVHKDPYAEVGTSYGSFNTLKNTVKVGSGLIDGKFTMDARLSQITSDGYIDRASSDLKSFYVSGAWLGKKSVLRANVFSGKEITYQAWWGTPQAVITGNTDALTTHYYNNLGITYLDAGDSTNLFSSGRTYNYYTYENEVDHYQQDHYQLHFLHSFSSKLNFNLAAHYTRGRGYYEQYRKNDALADYGLSPVIFSNDTVTNGDFIRRRWLDNHFYGGIFSLNYSDHKGLDITWGGAVNQYLGGHYGEIIWAEFASNSQIRDHYYDSDATKLDASSYLKATYEWKKFTFYGDLQYRHINYSFVGPDQVNGELVDTDQNVSYDFFNPKAGIMYDFNARNNVYASVAVANREPVRDDFTNSTSGSRPSHETLQNVETGYRYKSARFMTNANVFLMYYKNQLILTGAINDVGAYARTNVAESYRAGIELEAGYRITKGLSLSGNFTYSQNKIPSFTEYYDDYDNGGQVAIQHSNTDLAFSPNLIASGALEYIPFKGMSLTFISKYVSKQFLDNTSNDDRSLNAYFVSSIDASYSWKSKLFKELVLGVQVNNLFNELYENNGYTYSYFYGGQTTTENFYYPQAGINFMTRLLIKL
ncbi:MAG: TonB-dependent receptor [Bacteroidetes bacterium]|nr:TonB-dependent receptor [Bacteroidota bacterium]